VTQGEAVIPPAAFGFRMPLTALDNDGTPVHLGDGSVRVISSAADQMFLDIKPEMQSKMPRYKGDLELINHSAGSLTSQAYHKRWNRKNEILADAAEKASVAAAWMGGRPYPQQRLNDAWTLVMGGQFHDTGAGTATPRSYEFAQSDESSRRRSDERDAIGDVCAGYANERGSGCGLQPTEHRTRGCGGSGAALPRWNAEGRAGGWAGWEGRAGTG
jgi:hypothetical protein